MTLRHRCHVPGCGVATAPRLLVCPAHWGAVDAATRAEVYRTVGVRNRTGVDATWAPWWRAAHRAIAQCMLRDGRPADAVATWLRREEKFADELDGGGT